MMIFDFIKFMLIDPRMEGGEKVWDDPDGGLTKYGFAQLYHPDLKVESLTLQQAIQYTMERYFYKYRIDNVPYELVPTVLDWVFNAGPDEIKVIQRFVNTRPDGIIGPKTKAALTEFLCREGTVNALGLLTALRLRHYEGKKNWKLYREGWSNRIAIVPIWTIGYEL